MRALGPDLHRADYAGPMRRPATSRRAAPQVVGRSTMPNLSRAASGAASGGEAYPAGRDFGHRSGRRRHVDGGPRRGRQGCAACLLLAVAGVDLEGRAAGAGAEVGDPVRRRRPVAPTWGGTASVVGAGTCPVEKRALRHGRSSALTMHSRPVMSRAPRTPAEAAMRPPALTKAARHGL